MVKSPKLTAHIKLVTNKLLWDQNWNEKITERKEAQKEYTDNPKLNNLLNYKRLDAPAKTLKDTKRRKWKEN